MGASGGTLNNCPECGVNKYSHDEWEDMYLCVGCGLFWYPEEIGLKTDKNAPIFQGPELEPTEQELQIAKKIVNKIRSVQK